MIALDLAVAADDRTQLALARRAPSGRGRIAPASASTTRACAHASVVASASSLSTDLRPSTRARATACSTRSIALSGRRRLTIEWSAKSSRTCSASSETVTPRDVAMRSRMLCRMGRVAAESSSDTSSVDRRRASESSRAIVVRYSSPVVAPITAMSPRASAGFSTAAAPRPPCVSPGRLEQVDLVEEQHDAGLRRLAHELLDALLELAAVLRAGHDRGQRHLDEPRVLQLLRHLARRDPLGQTLDDRGLADARRPEQHRVALGRAQQRLDDPRGLFLAPDDRRQQALARQLGQVPAEPIEQRASSMRLVLPMAVGGGCPSVVRAAVRPASVGLCRRRVSGSRTRARPRGRGASHRTARRCSSAASRWRGPGRRPWDPGRSSGPPGVRRACRCRRSTTGTICRRRCGEALLRGIGRWPATGPRRCWYIACDVSCIFCRSAAAARSERP